MIKQPLDYWQAVLEVIAYPQIHLSADCFYLPDCLHDGSFGCFWSFFELLYSLIFWLFFCAEDVTGIVSYIQSRDVAYRIAIFKIRPTGTGTGYL